MSVRLFLAFALLALTVCAKPLAHDDHDHAVRRGLPDTWYHTEDHPAHALFRRQSNPTDGATYPVVGSAAWRAAYPPAVPDSTKLPQAWVDALNAAISAGKIPNIPPTTESGGNAPVYPQGVQPDSPQVCAATNRVCRGPDDIWDAPTGNVGVGFDDGPLPTSAPLYAFLQQNNQHATHFFIGVNILANPDMFTMAYATLQDDIAVHTWTHPYLTTLSNLDLVAQFGWSMQLIHDSTGGRLPRFWRPPYGDFDNRVRAIATSVFGLKAILWNQDTEDWSLTSNGTTPQKINASMEQWLTGPKSPGLIILEHELSAGSVQAFIDAYPVMKANGWNTTSVAKLASNGGPTWANSNSEQDAVTSMGILGGAGAPAPTPGGSSNSSSSASASSSSHSSSSSASAAQQTAANTKSNGAIPLGTSWLSAGVVSAVSLLVASLL